MKRFNTNSLVCYIIAVVMVFGLLAGCSGASKPDASKASDTQAPSTSTEAQVSTVKPIAASPNNFKLYTPEQTIPINLDSITTKAIEEATGIVWKNIEIGNGSDAAQQVNLKLASGDLPNAYDTIKISAGNQAGDSIWTRLIKEKVVIPLDEYFSDDIRYPNLAKIDKRILDYWRASDGHVYFVPVMFEPVLDEPSAWNSNPQGLYIREDLLKKAGMTTADLETLSGFEEFLSKIKEMKDEKGRPYIPLSLDCENFVMQVVKDVVEAMFGVAPWNEENNKMVPNYQTAGFKQAWQWLNKLYRKGLLDQESPYQKKDLFMEKNLSFRYGAMFTAWNNPDSTIMQQENIDPASTITQVREKGVSKWMSPIPLPKIPGVKLAPYSFFNPFGSNGISITTSCKNPDLLMKAYDWMLTPEANTILTYGPESFGAWSKDVEGNIVQNGDVISSKKMWGGAFQTVTESGFWWWLFVCSTNNTHIPMIEAPWPAQNAMSYEAEQISQKQGTFSITPKYARIKAPIGGAIEKYNPTQNDIILKYEAKMMMAKTDADFEAEYNNFLNEMKVRGHDEETIAEFNAQYSVYNETSAGKIEVTVKRYLEHNVYGTEPMPIGR